jgi:predicted nucleotidyltransferase
MDVGGRTAIQELAQRHGLLAVYLFGSRADDGLRLLAGETALPEGSDLDVGVFFPWAAVDFRVLNRLQVELEDLFDPLRVDLVPLDRVDGLFQHRAIDGHRIAAPDSTAADFNELTVLRRAEDLLPIQREIERQRFGWSST